MSMRTKTDSSTVRVTYVSYNPLTSSSAVPVHILFIRLYLLLEALMYCLKLLLKIQLKGPAYVISYHD